MKKQVRIDGNYLLVDGERVPLLSGEFHYFRHAQVWWAAILDTIVNGGLTTISSYVCWDFHELEPGRYDFTGESSSQRDLDGFLSLCEKKGVYVLLRPGPYIGAEWKNWGVPDHAAAYHRLHPEFLQKAQHYVKAVLDVVHRHQVTEGGCVLVVQVDNEIDMNQSIYTPTVGHPCFSPLFWRQIITEGAAGDPGTYRGWFRQKYGTIDALNQAWDTTYRDFWELEPPLAVPVTLGERRRLLDTQVFWEEYSTSYLAEMLKVYRSAGLSVPLAANTYSSPLPMNWPQMQAMVDLVGPDFYCSTPVRPEELHGMSLGVRLARATNRIPWSPEFQAGTVPTWVETRGVVTPEHHRYMGLLGMLFGLKGWNWYMLVNRDEWYFSPINEKGEAREQYLQHFKDLVRVFRATDWPDAGKCCQTGLLWYRPHYWFAQHPAKSITHVMLGAAARVAQARKTGWTQVFSGLHASDIDFELYDPGAGPAPGPASAQPGGKGLRAEDLPLLIYAGFDFVDDDLASQLLDYVRSGGNVVIFGTLPGKDLASGGPSRLAGVLPPMENVFRWGGEVRCVFDGQSFSAVSDLVCCYNTQGYPGTVPLHGLGGAVGYVRPYGSGCFCVIGLDACRETLAFAHNLLHVPIPSQADLPGILTSAWRGGEGVLLVVVNTSPEVLVTTVALDLEVLGLGVEQPYVVTEMLSGDQQEKRSAQLAELTLSVKGRDGLILRIAQS
jgi:beta-galactosidase